MILRKGPKIKYGPAKRFLVCCEKIVTCANDIVVDCCPECGESWLYLEEKIFRSKTIQHSFFKRSREWISQDQYREEVEYQKKLESPDFNPLKELRNAN